MLRPLAASAVALAVALQPLGARAADATTQGDHRALAGHYFLPSHLVEDPFSVTSFGMNTAFGFGQALGPRLDLSTDPPTIVGSSKWYDYASLGEQFDLTVRILEYLSVHGGLVAGIRQGAGNGSALVVGTNVQVTGLLGAKGSLPIGDALRLSLSGEGLYGPQMNVLLLSGLREGIQNGKFSFSDAFKSRDALTANVTGAVAWAPLAWLGLVGNLRYIHTKKVNIEETSQDGLAAAVDAEFDALPLVDWLPLGANLAYRRTGSLGSGGLALQDEFGVGFYYTGRKDLALGLEVDERTGRLETELRSNQTVAWVNFRYYW
jgi:hypothetical protein